MLYPPSTHTHLLFADDVLSSLRGFPQNALFVFCPVLLLPHRRQYTVLSTLPMYRSIKLGMFPGIVAQTGTLESSQTAHLARWNLSHKWPHFAPLAALNLVTQNVCSPCSIYRPLSPVMWPACHPYSLMTRPVGRQAFEALWVSPGFPAKCWDIVWNSATASTFHITGDTMSVTYRVIKSVCAPIDYNTGSYKWC
jgi:hypothetical protein